MTKLKVIGIGSPFGDDQLGWEVVKLLEQSSELHPFLPNPLQISYCDRPGMHLLELMRGANTVFLIDAIKANTKCGTIHRFKNQEIEAINSALSSHALGVAYAIKMGRVLNDLPPTIFLYGIEIGENHCQFGLSEPVTQAIKCLYEEIKIDILQWLRSSS